MNLQKACVILTTSVVCAVVVYYTWSMYTELNSLKYRLLMIELQSSKQLKMEISEDNEDNENDSQYVNFGGCNNSSDTEEEQVCSIRNDVQLKNEIENNQVRELFKHVDDNDADDEADEECNEEEEINSSMC